jgi:hypothetical protein
MATRKLIDSTPFLPAVLGHDATEAIDVALGEFVTVLP